MRCSTKYGLHTELKNAPTLRHIKFEIKLENKNLSFYSSVRGSDGMRTYLIFDLSFVKKTTTTTKSENKNRYVGRLV